MYALVLAIFISSTLAAQHDINFYFDPYQDGYNCSFAGTSIDCDSGNKQTYGGCANVPDASLDWCCPASENICWGWKQDCQLTGKTACPTSNGGNEWCCDAIFEDCGVENICIPKLNNPMREYLRTKSDYTNANPSKGDFSTVLTAEVGDAFSLFPTSAFATSGVATGTVKVPSTSTPSASTSKPSSASQTTSETALPTTSGQAAEKNNLGSGASAGLGVGATFLVIAIIAGIFLYRRRKRQAAAAAIDSSNSKPSTYNNAYDPMMGPQSQEMAADLRYASPELAGKPVYQELEEPRPGPFQPKIEYELEAPGSRVG